MKMMKSIVKFAIVAYAAGSIVACDQIPVAGETSAEGDGSTTATTGGTGFTGGTANAGAGVPADVMTSILGLWRGECEGSEGGGGQGQDQSSDPSASQSPPLLALLGGGDGEGEYSVDEMRFTNTGAVQRQLMFLADGCAEADIAMEMKMHMNYKVGDAVAKVPGGRDIDFEFVGGEMIVQNADMVDMFNDAGMCGLSDWEKGVSRDMKDIDFSACGGDKGEGEGEGESEVAAEVPAVDTTAALAAATSPTSSTTTTSGTATDDSAADDSAADDSEMASEGKGPPAIGETLFDIFKIDGNKIYFGQGSDGSSRPKKLDTDRFMTKVVEAVK